MKIRRVASWSFLSLVVVFVMTSACAATPPQSGAAFEAKMKQLQELVPKWLESGGSPAEIGPLGQQLKQHLEARDFRRAEEVLDRMLAIVKTAPSGPPPGPPPGPIADKATRSYRMGFSYMLPPLKSDDALLRRLDMWSKRADGSIEHIDVPWKKLLAGVPAEQAVDDDLMRRLRPVRSRGITFNVVTIEPLDGVRRNSESPELIAARRSITEPAVQKVYREYAVAVAKRVRPPYLGLAAEVNLFKMAGSQKVYQALVQMTNDAAKDVRAAAPDVKLYVSVQTELAWKRGIDDTLSEYPFINALGLSTYPASEGKRPENLPDDYFSRFVRGKRLPVLITESGWPSKFDKIRSSEEVQTRWIKRFAQLADSAGAEFITHILFSDFDKSIRVTDELSFFASQGLVDSNLNPKPALATWDAIFKRRYEH